MTPDRFASPADWGIYSDAEWIARIRDGDRGAFEALVKHYADPLCGFVYNTIGDSDATQELVQDLFLWIWQNRLQWEIRGALTTYLYRSARNRAISYVRHERLERRWLEQAIRQAPPATDPRRAEHASEEQDLRSALARALESLPDRCRQVFLLSRAHGLSYADISQTLGISIKTVEIHMSRALSILRSQLDDWLV
jgi:RNA polymerase sigma-70 factor (ECF subfamily)